MNDIRTLIREHVLMASARPLVSHLRFAHGSFVEAADAIRNGAAPTSSILDTLADFQTYFAPQSVVPRLDPRVEDNHLLDLYCDAAVGAVFDWDEAHGTALAATMRAWFDAGCNTTAAAGLLHFERQTVRNGSRTPSSSSGTTLARMAAR